MVKLARFFYCFLFLIVTLFSSTLFASDTVNIAILCYHNFNPTTPGSMNLTPQRFEDQMKWLKENGFTFVPLSEVVEYLQGKRTTLPEKSVVITADDGWQSQYIYMVPLVKKYNIPVTLFIYPETISKGKNAMTWDELKELQQTGLFDVQGHTYSHPNFKQERKHLSPTSYNNFVNQELVHSKKILEDKLGKKITLLAWPFGIYNSDLEQAATNAGYTMAFSIDDRTANRSFKPMAQPRFMIIQSESMKTFAGLVNEVKSKAHLANTREVAPKNKS